MKFGVFYEHQLPRPWEADSEQRLIQDALEQIEFADALGIDYVWEVEHHFLEEYSHSSAPEVFLAAASQRTKRIRLGHGIVQTPPPFNHPARIAERISMLDLVSNGRVDFGTGESQLGGRARWVPDRPDGQTRDVGGRAARRVALHDRGAVHRPRGRVRDDAAAQRRARSRAQQPHPPVWVACSRRDTILLAAQKGIGALAFAFVDPEEARHWVEDYHRTMERGWRADRRRGEQRTRMRHHVHVPRGRRDRDRPRPRGRELLRLLAGALLRVRSPPARRDRRVGRVRAAAHGAGLRPGGGRGRGGERPDRLGAKVVEQGTARACGARSGPPIRCASTSAATRKRGVDQVIFTAQAGKNRHEHIMESLELFGREVLPEFMEREEQRGAATERSGPRAVTDIVMPRKPAERSSAAADARLRVPGDPASHGRSLRFRRLPCVVGLLRRPVRRRRQPDE